MTRIHYFVYIFFHTYLKIKKIILLEIRLNKLLEKKMNYSKQRLDMEAMAKSN